MLITCGMVGLIGNHRIEEDTLNRLHLQSIQATYTMQKNNFDLMLDDVARTIHKQRHLPRIGRMFGPGILMMHYTPPTDDCGKWGPSTRIKDASIFGQKLTLMNISIMIHMLNMMHSKEIYNNREIDLLVYSKFMDTLVEPDKGLVLAPRHYKTETGSYTALAHDRLLKLHPGFKKLLDLDEHDDTMGSTMDPAQLDYLYREGYIKY